MSPVPVCGAITMTLVFASFRAEAIPVGRETQTSYNSI